MAKTGRTKGLALAAVLLLAGAGLAALMGRQAAPLEGSVSGIEIEGLRLSAAGYMLDLRYTVVDPDAASPFLDRSVEPHLVDMKTGAMLPIPVTPKLGALRQTASGHRVEAGRTYFMLFKNPGRALRPGDQVKLVVGDIEEMLTVL